MIKKILFCATVDYHFRAFHLPFMKWLKQQGYEVHVAAAGDMELPYTDKKYPIPIQRSPLHTQNKTAYKQLKHLIDRNNYDIIDCHTPMGGVLARLAARKARKQGTKVIYTAHGFHFCVGAPFKNWLLYYPIEKYLSRITDELLTINSEDFQLATKRHFKAKHIDHIHGVGVDTERFKQLDEQLKVEYKKSFGYKADDFLLFYAAEFNANKNQQFLIRSLTTLKESIPHVKLVLAGDGPMLESCIKLAEALNVAQHVEFLGLRDDIDKLVPMCDVAVASSLREGLPVNVMEAMACGLPIVAVDNRGHRELVQNNKNGWLVHQQDIETFSKKIISLYQLPDVKEKFGQSGRHTIMKKYSISKVLAEKRKIYQTYLNEKEDTNWAIH